jgi:predicted nucleotidyltransferase
MIELADITALCARIAREFKPERIILFGSHAYGHPRGDSDVDLLVILPFEGRPFRKSLEILDRISPPFALDLLARRPDDTARRYADGDPLIREALDRGKVLYERDRA